MYAFQSDDGELNASSISRPLVAILVSLASNIVTSRNQGIKALALCNAVPSRVKLSSIFSFF